FGSGRTSSSSDGPSGSRAATPAPGEAVEAGRDERSPAGLVGARARIERASRRALEGAHPSAFAATGVRRAVLRGASQASRRRAGHGAAVADALSGQHV